MRYDQISGFGGQRWDRDEKFVQRSINDAFTVKYRIGIAYFYVLSEVYPDLSLIGTLYSYPVLHAHPFFFGFPLIFSFDGLHAHAGMRWIGNGTGVPFYPLRQRLGLGLWNPSRSSLSYLHVPD